MAEHEVVEESSKNLRPDENETKEEGPSPEQILKQITDCFGETVGITKLQLRNIAFERELNALA